ncbi:MAG: WS/DGAT/MGAT family O-acyltransferase [Solirubrobacteraceae bacterium]
MAQKHLDRLSSTDAGFLHQETSSAHMHIGGLLIFQGPPPPLAAVLDHIRRRLHLVPRYRQKLTVPAPGIGRPLWVDDPNFNLEYHVHSATLRSPGGEAELLDLAAQILSTQLDRTKPLWEFWIVEGLAPAANSEVARFALISKTHHALVDGVSGVDLATVMLDFSPAPTPIDSTALRPWQPRPEPAPRVLVQALARDGVRRAAQLGLHGMAAITKPRRAAMAVRDAAEGLGELAWTAMDPAPATPLNVPIGPRRRFTILRHQLNDYKTVKNQLGGTVNDVVLSVVSGGLRAWLLSRGVSTDGLQMRALVPVSVRPPQERYELGNRLTAIRGPLPVYIADAATRLRTVTRAMDDLKRSKQAIGASTLVAMNDLAPPAVLAQASRIQFSTRLFNLLVTNVPGPQLPLYILGRRLDDFFPLAFLPQNHALAVAIMSYNGRVEYGLLADYDALPDLETVADGIDGALRELLAAAAQLRSPAQTWRLHSSSQASTAAQRPAPRPPS